MANSDIDFDYSTLTLEEIEQFEDALDCSFDRMQAAIESGELRTTRLTRVIGWLLAKRQDPDFTLDDAGKLTIKQINELATKVGDASPEA